MNRPIAATLRTLLRWPLAVVASAMLAACGGGAANLAGGGIVGTGSAPFFSVGAITGFGADSVVMTAQEISLGGAVISVNDQPATAAALKIGMVVSVEGDVRADGSRVARTVAYRAEARGVVDGVDTTAGAFTLLGQRVPVNGLTVFEGGTFATLVSQYVEVSGYRAAPGEVVATRVEIKPTFVPGVTPLQVTGTVSTFDATSRTFRIGAQLVDYSALAPAQLPAAIADGATAETKGTTFNAAGALVATSIQAIAPTPPVPAGASIEIEGYVADFASVASFKVNGQLVNASAATAEGGTLDMLANGVKVEIEGRFSAGVLVATKVEFEDVPTLVLDGLVEALDSGARTMTLAGQLVSVGASTQFEDQSAAAVRDFGFASIAVGDRLVVRAVRTSTRLIAQRVERRNRTAPPSSDPTAEVEGAITAFVSVADFDVGARKVNANSATFSGGTASSLAVGVRVRVQGTLADTVIIARTVEILPADSAAPTDVEIRGAIEAFVSVANFRVAGQTVDATSAQFYGGTAANLANGRNVEVKGTLSGGVVHARSVEFEDLSPPTPTIEAEGLISSFVSISNFRIAGQLVDASAARFTEGRASDLANGRRAHAVGPLVNGVLRATTISVEDADDDQQVELEGAISNFVSVSQFTVAGRTVDASAARFSHGTAANLANGRRVGVKGTLVNGVVRASSVEFK